MIKHFLLLLTAWVATAAAAVHVEPTILARVGDKSLTAMDVKRRMDFVFQHQYPQYAKDSMARYEFYKNSWQGILRDMIQTEMILAHVAQQEERIKQKIVSDSDVHRELHERFGPDVIASLSNIGMTYEEACTMLRREMQVGNMVYISVQDKVKRKLRPEEIRRRYALLVDSMHNKTRWRYQVVTIESASEADRRAAAKLTHQILDREGLASLTNLTEKAKSAAAIQLVSNESEKPPEFSVSVSATLETGCDDIAPERAQILGSLKKGEWSAPTEQTMRKSKKRVEQIFVLHSKMETQPPSFDASQEQLRLEITNQLYQQEMANFLGQLEERFPVEILYSESDQPFKLQ